MGARPTGAGDRPEVEGMVGDLDERVGDAPWQRPIVADPAGRARGSTAVLRVAAAMGSK